MPTQTKALEDVKNSFVATNATQAAALANIESNFISTESLAPTKPLNVPFAPAPTDLNSFDGYLQTLTASAGKAGKAKDNSLGALMSSYLGTQGEASLTNQAYGAQGGVDTLQSELNDLNAQLMGEQHGLQREIERLEQNPEGLTGRHLTDRINGAKTASLRKQADIAVVQMAKQGQFNSAKSIADRAVTAQLEKDRQRNEILKFIYEENKDAFTTAEKREFDIRHKERERELENKEYRLRADFDAKIKQSDPLYLTQLENARAQLTKTRADATIAAASATVTPLKLARQQTRVNEITDILNNPTMGAAVGPNLFARGAIAGFTGSKANFIGKVEQLRSQLSIESLLEAKANGATFGALSEGELRVLSSSATALESWANKNGSGQVTGYSVDEASFKAELDKINYFVKLDYILKGGDPANVQVQIMPDGTMWTQRSDGYLDQLITQ